MDTKCPKCGHVDPLRPRGSQEQAAEIARLRAEVVRVGVLHGQTLIERDALKVALAAMHVTQDVHANVPKTMQVRARFDAESG